MTQVADIWHDLWVVNEARATTHGFDLLLGRPVCPGRRGLTTIITAELAAHLEAFRAAGGRRGGGIMDLPIGRETITRIRRLLGHHYVIDQAAWWEARSDEVLDLPVQVFADRYARSVGSVVKARAALLGPRQRTCGWWREPDVAAVILADLPRAEIADRLGMSVGAIGRLRSVLRKESV